MERTSAAAGEAVYTGSVKRRFPIGAEVVPDAGVHFRVWAPRARDVKVVFSETGATTLTLQPEQDGYYSGLARSARSGDRYQFQLDNAEKLYPDPASRFQPDGPHGPSEIVNPDGFRWSDNNWRGVTADGQVIYEMHIGTFTREGTWASAIEELQRLSDLGITCLEVMPVPEFAGRFGWGYDGVNLFAPYHHYGTPDDARRFIDRAHALGLGVILDVVYNHLGPDGNYLPAFSNDYFNAEHHTDWGDALNFDGRNAAPVREYFVSNAVYWIREFHFDGFRFDATQSIIDSSPKHVLAVITEEARKAAGAKSIYLVNENEPQNTQLVRPIKDGGFGMDALWNDDFHHSALVALSDHDEAYYSDHPGSPQEFISAAKWGYLYQGQRYKWQQRRRGTPALDLPPTAFVNFLQNHDQIANSGLGLRAHQITSPGHLKAMTALLLLMPQTPMLFQGQEYAAPGRFHYFADHNPELAKLVRAGRKKELSQFPSIATEEMQARLPDPDDVETFNRCKLDSSNIQKGFHAEMHQLHKDLIALRKTEPVFRRVQRRGDLDGAVLGQGAFVLRYFGEKNDDRLVLTNLARDLHLCPSPEPLLAPPLNMRWKILWSSEDPRYGGSGTAALDTEEEGWFIPGRATVVLKPVPVSESKNATRVQHRGSAQAPKKKEK